ncbi:hypothetical protein BpHYR1_054647 [Brachionus plicatilis]|uniref:Uncharacterized protein n=1 Tax=Brachionus plicatilis TaxID=10195 RepID=A0A3M7R1S6_BRAPC|nr:hypothetical protein BpHYR1_054647 [Brachionus plicatilis]
MKNQYHSRNLLIHLAIILIKYQVKKYSNFIKDKNLLVKPNYYSKKCYQTNCNICQFSCENLRKSLSNYDKCSEVAIHFNIIDLNDDLILILDPEEGHFGRNASINKIISFFCCKRIYFNLLQKQSSKTKLKTAIYNFFTT